MSGKDERRLTAEQVDLINQVLSDGDRVEVVPVKDGLKILRTRRKEIKPRN